MNKEKCQQLFQYFCKQYQKLESYFTSGSFGVKFYPFLMYPCVRYSQSLILRSLAVLSVFIGLYFFVAELVTILFSPSSILTYIQHTMFELSLPNGTLIEDRIIQLSPLSFAVRASFLVQSYCFVIIYIVAVMRLTHGVRLIAALLAICFSSGMALIYSAQGGSFTIGGLQNIGVSITFLIGNLTLLITGLTTQSNELKFFKKFSLIAGLIGTFAILFTLIEPTIYLPIIERISLYTILSWEIVAGFTLLKQVK